MIKGRPPDYIMILVVAALLLIGLVMVFSTTFDWAYMWSREGVSPYYYTLRQAAWMVTGIAIAAALTFVPYDWLRRQAVPIMSLTLGLLILVLIIGEDHLGARRAFLGGSIQPGELAKLTTVIYIAAWASSKGERIRDVTYGLIPFAVLVGIASGLVARQPDLSTAAVIMLTGLTAFFLSGADLLQMVISVIVGGTAFSLLALVYPHAHQRVEEFLLQLHDPLQIGSHVRASLISLGSGGLFGVGLGLGRQKFGYLPVPHTDSIFAVIGEEMGLSGCLLVMVLFGLLAWRGFRIALRARDQFGMVLASSVTLLLVSQAMINIAVSVGLLPYTGIILPFISLGGSSLLVSLAGVGILLSISRGSAPKAIREDAHLDSGRRNGRARLSRSGRPAGA
jgi:cell division protein FtsW